MAIVDVVDLIVAIKNQNTLKIAILQQKTVLALYRTLVEVAVCQILHAQTIDVIKDFLIHLDLVEDAIR